MEDREWRRMICRRQGVGKEDVWKTGSGGGRMMCGRQGVGASG